MHSHAQRLTHGTLLDRKLIRQLEAEICGVVHILRKRAVDRRGRKKSDLRVQVVAPLPATGSSARKHFEFSG